MVVLSRIVSLFLVLIVGSLVGRFGLVSKSFRKDLTQFLTKVALPLYIFQIIYLGSRGKDLSSGLTMIKLSFMVYGIEILLASLLARLWPVNSSKRPSYAFAMVFPNMTFLGLPVLEAALGAEGVFYGAFFVLFVDLIMWTYGVYLFKGSQGGFKLAQIITPTTIGVFVALVFLALDLDLGEMITMPIAMIGGLSPPLSMIILGLLLADMRKEDLAEGPVAFVASLYRLLVVPGICYLILRFLGYTSYYLYIPVIIMAMPVAAMGAVQASTYGEDHSSMTGLIVLSTLMSVATIPLLINFLL